MSILGSITSIFAINTYSIKVVDSVSGNTISGAQCVVRKTMGGSSILERGITNSKGIYTFISITYNKSSVYIEVSKNGYTPGGMNITNNDKGSNRGIGILNLQPNQTFSKYTINVKDDYGYNISGATIDVFNNTSTSVKINDNNLSIEESSTGKYVVTYIDNNRLYFEVYKNGHEKSERFYVDPAQTKNVILNRENLKDYYYNVCVQNKNLDGVPGVKIQFYKDFQYTKRYNNETYTSDQKGIVSLYAGKLSKTPLPIYAKYVDSSIPDGYVVTKNNQGGVVASESSMIPQLILKVEDEEPLTYYYTIQVKCETTQKPLKSIAVDYVYNDNVLSSQVTDDDGVVTFSCNYQNGVHIMINENEYEDVDITYSGRENKEEGILINLKPKNTVRVVKKNKNGEDVGIKGKKIRVFKYENGKAVILGTYTTYDNGYIDTLDNSLYTTDLLNDEGEELNTTYITVINHSVTEKDKELLTEKLQLGHISIELPDEVSDTTEFETDNSRFNELSIYNIKNNISTGNSDIQNKGTSRLVEYHNADESIVDDFRVNIVDPDSIGVYDIFACKPVTVKDNKKVIGSVDVGLKSNVNELRLKMINRYSGYYNPIFKDIVFYNNFSETDEKQWPYSNTSFDSKYEDNYGNFGVINNMWFHKANQDKNNNIIDTLTPVYPLTGQYALDHRDYNIFSSSWDMDYYTKQTDIENYETCKNIASMKEQLCMFGSKYLNVPESIEICGVSIGDSTTWNGEWEDDWITNPSGCPGEIMFKEINDNNVNFYVFLKKRIVRYFQDKLRSEFEKYIGSQNPNYSFGKEGIDDDIEEYVTKNILKLYKLEKVRFFVRRTKVGQHNSKIENDYVSHLEDTVSELKQQGFDEIRNVHMSKMNRDDFDRKFVYNLVTGMKEEFGFAFILKKI